MKHQRKLLIIASLLLAGCAGTIQTASITEAYKKYNQQNYQATLEKLYLAENAKDMPAPQRAELAYLKAQAYEGLGEIERALTLYQYLAEQHADTQYGYHAARHLRSGDLAATLMH